MAASPGSHGVHAATPALENDPAAHGVQPHDPFSPVTSENVPAGHGVHAPEPATSLYSPAPHASHGSPFCPVYPGKHEHCDLS